MTGLSPKSIVVGAEIEKDGKKMNVRAKRGVVLAAGGFPRNRAMREKYLKDVTTVEWTLAAKGNTGDAIRMGMDLGAAVDLMDDAWWGPTILPTNKSPLFMLMERAYPGGIFVNSAGERFTNESASYVDVVHDMCEKNREEAIRRLSE